MQLHAPFARGASKLQREDSVFSAETSSVHAGPQSLSLSCHVSYVQPPGPIALDHEPPIHTSQDGSINKSPRRYLSEA